MQRIFPAEEDNAEGSARPEDEVRYWRTIQETLPGRGREFLKEVDEFTSSLDFNVYS